MTLQRAIREKELTRYRLSKISGIHWATLADVDSGKTKIERCSGSALMKLSKALDLSLEQLLALEIEHKRPPVKTDTLEVRLPFDKRSPGHTWRESAPASSIWIACGMSCKAPSTQTSGAVKSARPRRNT